METVVESEMQIKGKTFRTLEKDVPIAELIYYEANPRIFSLLQGNNLSQEEIDVEMRKFDHVKKLVQSIGDVGLIEPLIVRQSDKAVLEGNSRLAAHRILKERDPLKYQKVRVKEIIDELSEDDVDSLLGQYHIVGKKDWEPYEQGTFLARQAKRGRTPEQLASEYGMTRGDINNLIKTAEFMESNEITDTKTWSYWEEYLKNRNIGNFRKDEEQREELDKLAIQKVAVGEIERAQEIRQLGELCGLAGDRRRGYIFEQFLDGEVTFSDALDAYNDGKDAASIINRAKKFKELMASASTKDCITSMSDQEKKSLHFELKKIKNRSGQLLRALGD